MPDPFVVSNFMSTSAAESPGALPSVSQVNVIVAAPRQEAMRRTSSCAVPASVSINGDREDAVVIESDQFPGNVFAGATDRVPPADALTVETQQEQQVPGTASPSRQLLREETTLSRALSRVMKQWPTAKKLKNLTMSVIRSICSRNLKNLRSPGRKTIHLAYLCHHGVVALLHHCKSRVGFL